MKKIYLFLFFVQLSASFSQTKLASHPLELKKSAEYHQTLTAVNSKNEVFVFACDKERFHLLKFNSALFFSDSLHLKRPDQSFEVMAGYSFDSNGNPRVYWASKNFKKVASVSYNLKNKLENTTVHSLPLDNETILTTFTENNAFYLLSRSDSDDFLKLYTFENGVISFYKLDFSTFDFISARGKKIRFHELLDDFPLEKMELENFNPLFYAVAKSKFYIKDNLLTLTFDHNPKQTQAFNIDLSTHSISQHIIQQPELSKEKSVSNSFLQGTSLYQLRLNEDELWLDIKDLRSAKSLKSYHVLKQDSIPFKNSPLYLQNGNQKPRDLKTTKKFLSRLSGSDVGLSVYTSGDDYLVTIGRAKNVASTGSILVGVSLGVGIAIAGGGGDVFMGDLFEDQNVQTVYFESLFSNDLQHKTSTPEALAVDYISEFLASHDEFRNPITFKYRDYFILGYYDSKNNLYVLQKFQDGYGW